jgi:hypothetical protein
MSWLTKAGNFNIEFLSMPFFNEPVLPQAPPTCVLHTTECSFEEALTIFNQHYAPHFLVGRDRTSATRIIQMVSIGNIGASLKAHNNLALVQIEIVAKSQVEPWLPDDQTSLALASLLRACKDNYGIPLTRPWPDGVFTRPDMNGVASADDPHRNQGQFGSISGIFGHGDVPFPDNHWDCGNFMYSKIFAMAEGINNP